MPRQLECLLLHTVRFGDKGYILKILGADGEQLDAVFMASANSKKNKRAFLHPLSALHLVLSDSKSTSLPYASQFAFQHGRSLVHAGPVKLSIALFMAEVLSKICQWQKSDLALYDLAIHHLESTLNQIQSKDLPISFLLDVIEWAGILPLPPEKPIFPLVFGIQSASFSTPQGNGLEPVFSPETSKAWLDLILHKNIPENPAQRRDLLDAMIRFLEWQFERPGCIQSHRIFAEMNTA